MSPLVQIQIVTWDSGAHLPRLFEGIGKQGGVSYEVLVIDNNSSDQTLEWLRANAPDVWRIGNNANLGFAQAHNQGFEVCQAPYVLILNPDTYLLPGFLKQIFEVIKSDHKIGSVGGKLYQQLPDKSRPGIIDSCGLEAKISGQVIDKGNGQIEAAKFDKKTNVFGISGACALYRVEALKSIKDKYGIFDARFSSYKEDADLAWRLKRAGWKAVYTPGALAVHRREVRAGQRQRRSDNIKQMSLRNHLLMLRKNLGWRDCWRIPFIGVYELAKFLYVALFEKDNLTAYKQALSTKH